MEQQELKPVSTWDAGLPGSGLTCHVTSPPRAFFSHMLEGELVACGTYCANFDSSFYSFSSQWMKYVKLILTITEWIAYASIFCEKKFIYIERATERGKGRSSIHCFITQMAAMTWLKPDISSGSYMWVQGPKQLSHSNTAFPRPLTGEQDQKWSSRDTTSCLSGIWLCR